MALEKTEAVILKTFNWSESSRTVVFFSKEYGRLPLVDKGGRSFKTKRGRLQPFSKLDVTFYSSEKESNGYVSDSELLQMYTFEKDGTLGRLAYGSAACEMLNMLLPDEQPQRAIYQYFIKYLEMIDKAEKQFLPSLFVAFFLRIISQLGYHPSLQFCVNCNKEINIENSGKEYSLSPKRGGVVCRSCQIAGDYYIPLSSDNLRLLIALQKASLSEACALPIGYQQTSLLLDALQKLLSYQADLKSNLKSLEFLEKLKNSQTIGL